MLGHEGLAALFSRISDRYDFVVVDAPSLEESDEAERLSFHVDTAILIVRWDESIAPVKAACRRVVGSARLSL
jgi:Mrp family chromosome partitioning ATPase